ncbi:ParA family protein [Rothia sp. P5766]|uniref:ParA family protein n=1 Tax=Rothia sp. P5766 TaxID=3402656 RepID=UPI003AE83CD9
MATTLSFFNNKGGVGKTTLACNFSHFLAYEKGKKVLVIDLDPQANATQLLLDEQDWEQIYQNKEASERNTVYKIFEHILDGDASINTDIKIYKSHRFLVDVLAGHPSLSKVEDKLSRAWDELKAGEISGARKTNWLNTLSSKLNYDYIVIDAGPSLGALNRTMLVGSDAFTTPVTADLFSLYALENIGEWMDSWAAEYSEAILRIPGEKIEKFELGSTLKSREGYIGYTIQQYIAKSSGGTIRPTAAYDRYKNQIPEKSAMLKKTSKIDNDSLALGIIPNMFSMVPLAQNAHAPISTLVADDGIKGAQFNQQEKYSAALMEIFKNISKNLEVIK